MLNSIPNETHCYVPIDILTSEPLQHPPSNSTNVLVLSHTNQTHSFIHTKANSRKLQSKPTKQRGAASFASWLNCTACEKSNVHNDGSFIKQTQQTNLQT